MKYPVELANALQVTKPRSNLLSKTKQAGLLNDGSSLHDPQALSIIDDGRWQPLELDLACIGRHPTSRRN